MQAPELIAEYWERHPKKRSGRASDTKTAKRPKRESREQKPAEPPAEDSESESASTFVYPDVVYKSEHLLSANLLAMDSWEELVNKVATVEAAKSGGLMVYLVWNIMDESDSRKHLRSIHLSTVTNLKCPQAV